MSPDYIKMLVLLGGFAGLIMLLRYGIQRLHLLQKFYKPNTSIKTLKIVESCAVDLQRRLIVVQWHNEKHLVLLNDQSALLIKSIAITADHKPLIPDVVSQ